MKRTLILSLCAMAAALALGATPAMAKGGHHDNGHGYHGKHYKKHYSKHVKNHHHWRKVHKAYRPRTVVNFSYGYGPSYFSYGSYYPRPAYYYPQPVHYHTAYCHH